MNNIDKTLLSGSMGTMLLKLLSEKDMYSLCTIEIPATYFINLGLLFNR